MQLTGKPRPLKVAKSNENVIVGYTITVMIFGPKSLKFVDLKV